MNRRNFITAITAAIGWVLGWKAKEPDTLGYSSLHVKVHEPPKPAKTYRLVKLTKTSLNEPDQFMWVLNDA